MRKKITLSIFTFLISILNVLPIFAKNLYTPNVTFTCPQEIDCSTSDKSSCVPIGGDLIYQNYMYIGGYSHIGRFTFIGAETNGFNPTAAGKSSSAICRYNWVGSGSPTTEDLSLMSITYENSVSHYNPYNLTEVDDHGNMEFTECKSNLSTSCYLGQDNGFFIHQFLSYTADQTSGEPVELVIIFSNIIAVQYLTDPVVFIPYDVMKSSNCNPDACSASVSVGVQDPSDPNPNTRWHYFNAGTITISLNENSKIESINPVPVRDFGTNYAYEMQKIPGVNSIMFLKMQN